MNTPLLRRLVAVSSLLILTLAAFATSEAAPSSSEPRQSQLAPTYRIFATREGLVGRMTGNGHIIQPRDRFVALPSWAVLSPKGTYKFQVRLTYKGRTVVVPVWDVGPWNTRDDYWNVNRRYKDLPVGRPMAEAAYYDGYNGGRDERGRKINNPNGIDIADGTYWDDLLMTRNDWVEVSYLWLGADPGPGTATQVWPPPGNDQGAPPPIVQEAPIEIEPGATAVDNSSSEFTANDGPWFDYQCGYQGTHTWTYSTNDKAKSENIAAWAPNLPNPAFYEVMAYIPPCGEVSATGSARYRIIHDGNTTEVEVDQQAAIGDWVSLGIYHFGSEVAPRVELSDHTDDVRRAVRYDVVSFAPRIDITPPNATINAIVRETIGYRINWAAEDDMSGAASFDVQVRQLPNGGWTDWKRETTEVSAWFGPDEGRHFAFRVRARDWAGNLEPWPAEADMTTNGIVANRSE